MKRETTRTSATARTVSDRLRQQMAPAHAPYPSTVPLWPTQRTEQAPWWSERMLLESFGQIALLRMYTQPTTVVQ